MQEKNIIPKKEDINNVDNLNLIILKLSKDLNSQKEFIQILKDNINKIISGDKDSSFKFKKMTNMLPDIIENLGIPFSEFFLDASEVINYYLENIDDDNLDIIKTILIKIINVFNFESAYNKHIELLKQILKYNNIDINKIEDNKRTNLSEIEKIYDELLTINNSISNLDQDKIKEIINEKMNKINEIEKKNIYPNATIEFLKEKLQKIETNIEDKRSENKENIPIQNINPEQNNNQIEYHPNIDCNKIYDELKDLRKIPLKDRTFFYKNESLAEGEDEFTEFKNYFYPLDEEQEKEIKRQYCGFLNNQGGRIYIGIKDQKIVKGIELNYKEQDIFRNTLVLYGSEFYPKCRLENIKVYFIPIKNMFTKKFIYNFYVVKIIITPGDPFKLYSMTIKGFNASKRLQGQSVNLTADEIEKEILDRAFLKISNVGRNKIQDFDDPKPEINYEFNFDRNQKENKDDDKKDKIKNNSKNNDNKKVEYIVLVKNIDHNLKVRDINKFFNGIGCSLQKFPKKEGKSTGFGKLHFASEETAREVIRKFNGTNLGGKKNIIMVLKKYTFFKKVNKK